MIVRVCFNSYGKGAKALADSIAEQIKTELADANPIVRVSGVPLAGNHDKVWAEVAIDFMCTNTDAAHALAERIAGLGIEARTYHDND